MPNSKSQTAIEAVRLDIEERGARIAYEALLDVCQDRKAPAQAKAAAGVAVLRAGGLYDAKRRPTLDDDPAGMTPDELREAVPVIEAELKRIRGEIAERAALNAQLSDSGDEDGEIDIFA